jgi:hypothetical protein
MLPFAVISAGLITSYITEVSLADPLFPPSSNRPAHHRAPLSVPFRDPRRSHWPALSAIAPNFSALLLLRTVT